MLINPMEMLSMYSDYGNIIQFYIKRVVKFSKVETHTARKTFHTTHHTSHTTHHTPHTTHHTPHTTHHTPHTTHLKPHNTQHTQIWRHTTNSSVRFHLVYIYGRFSRNVDIWVSERVKTKFKLSFFSGLAIWEQIYPGSTIENWEHWCVYLRRLWCSPFWYTTTVLPLVCTCIY